MIAPFKGRYFGIRCRGSETHVTNLLGENLQMRFDLIHWDAPPKQFEWGDMSREASQLAVSILADYLKDDVKAIRLYKKFKVKVIAKIEENSFSLFPQNIDEFLETI